MVNKSSMNCVALYTVPDTERVQRSAETASFPPTTLSTDRVTILPTEKIPTSSHSPPQQHHSVQLGSRKVSERSAEVEDSQDGSYLWLQRQLQWRAGSHLLPANTAVRDIIRVSSGETSPSSGLYQERRSEIRGGDGDEARENVLGAGMSVSMSQSAETSGSVASPGAIPNFRTLQDQQVSLNLPPDFFSMLVFFLTFHYFILFYSLEKIWA